MDRKAIENMIIKNNLFFDNDIFVIHKDGHHYVAHGIDDMESGFYINGEAIEIDDPYDSLDLYDILQRFNGVLFCNGDIAFCDDSWDGFQPIFWIKDYYTVPKKDPLERIF